MDRFLIHTQGWIKGFYPASLLITVHQECWSDTTVLAEMLQRNALNSWMCTITIRPPNGQHWQHQLVSINIALQANKLQFTSHTHILCWWVMSVLIVSRELLGAVRCRRHLYWSFANCSLSYTWWAILNHIHAACVGRILITMTSNAVRVIYAHDCATRLTFKAMTQR